MKLSKSQSAKVNRALDNHDALRNTYFWSNNGNASTRSWKERQHTFAVKFRHQGHLYEYDSDLRLSRNNAYYTGCFSIDGTKKDVRLFKKLVA